MIALHRPWAYVPSTRGIQVAWNLQATLRACSTVTGDLTQSVQDDGEEIKIPTPWGHIAGVWWGPRDQPPLLALHGWQDNAYTWLPLRPLLPPNVPILAIDFPGHGLSSRYPSGIFYNTPDNVINIRRIVQYFNWKSVSLLGHSMGAIISFRYASCFPDDVNLVIQLDNLKPVINHSTNSVENIGNCVDSLLRADERNIIHSEPPAYTYEELVERLHLGSSKSIDKDKCHILLKRAIAMSTSNPEKYYFTRDSKLKYPYPMTPSHESLRSMALKITCPFMNIKFAQGGYFEPKANYDDILKILINSNAKFEFHTTPGTHHAHVNNPSLVAPLINSFLQKYYL